MTSPFLDDILAVIVLYQKRAGESETLLSLAKSLSGRPEKIDIVIHDNSPAPRWHDDEKECDGFHIRYISDPSNPGVSKAYNAGFQVARQLRKKWLLLLDQDTVFPEGALAIYAAHIEKYGEPPLLAPMLVCDGRIYSPCRHVANVNRPLRVIRPGWARTKGLSLLNSGLCIRLDAFEKIGGFDEGIRLDFADHDFMRRCRKYFTNFVVMDMVCRHGFSDKETRDIDISLARFGQYCDGAKNSMKSIADPFSLLPLALVRAARLCFRFRSVRFLKVLVKTFCRS
jgi:rhamnosyltransferase